MQSDMRELLECLCFELIEFGLQGLISFGLFDNSEEPLQNFEFKLSEVEGDVSDFGGEGFVFADDLLDLRLGTFNDSSQCIQHEVTVHSLLYKLFEFYRINQILRSK